jgi:hypothetical protein
LVFLQRFICHLGEKVIGFGKVESVFSGGQCSRTAEKFGASGDVPSSQNSFRQSLITSRQSLPFFQSLIAIGYSPIVVFISWMACSTIADVKNRLLLCNRAKSISSALESDNMPLR